MMTPLVVGFCVAAVIVIVAWPRRNKKAVRPGIVVIEKAIDEARQARLASLCFEVGAKKWYIDGKLNAWRQGRGRYYDACSAFPSEITQVCRELVAKARRVEALGSEDHTHLLLLYYQDIKRGLGWHRDDGPIDGTSLEPVVSLSLGCTCDFLIKDRPSDPPLAITLKSGDAIIFGGPARHVMHKVQNIRPGSSVLGDFRLNLTWRHAPELTGLEGTDRFFHFGAATRAYLDTERTKGTEEARANTRRRRRLASS